MHGATTAWLTVWEQGVALQPVERGLALLAAACPQDDRAFLERLSVGRRDRLLLDARARTFGPRCDAVATCPSCGATVEFGIDTSVLRVAAPDVDEDTARVTIDGRAAHVRLPDSRDLHAIAGVASSDDAHAMLVARCATFDDGTPVDTARLSPDALALIDERLEALDPQGAVAIGIVCPGCGHAWDTTYDVVAFFWRELDTWAARTLADVHTIAATYGWRERDILAMSPARRGAYLSMIASQ